MLHHHHVLLRITIMFSCASPSCSLAQQQHVLLRSSSMFSCASPSCSFAHQQHVLFRSSSMGGRGSLDAAAVLGRLVPTVGTEAVGPITRGGRR
jgi:hypothetical protein